MRLNFGTGGLEFRPPEGCEVVLPAEMPMAPAGEIMRALDCPAKKRIEDLDGAKRAVILVSDSTRPAPSNLLIPPLCERLRGLGIQDIGLVFGLGTHRRMSDAEAMALLGDSCRLPHSQHEKDRCIHLGDTSRGTPVEIFEEVASADAIIATGNIEYHYYAGYSGGGKAVLPGVSSERSITMNHMMMRDPLSRTGNRNSPVRLDMEEAAGIAGLDFILNVVLNSNREIVRAVAGDYIISHRQGADVVDAMYLQKVKPAEIVIVCAGGRPKDLNLYQAHKALDNAKEAVMPGGTLILLAECSEGLGNGAFERWACEAKNPEDCLQRFGKEYEFGGHKAAYIADLALKSELILVSSLPKETAEMCFMKPARTLDEALSMARDRNGADVRTLVLPHGDMTLARAI